MGKNEVEETGEEIFISRRGGRRKKGETLRLGWSCEFFKPCGVLGGKKKKKFGLHLGRLLSA